MEGKLYAKTVEGASNAINFLNFSGEAGQVATPNDNPVIEFGDYINMDNCVTHRFEGGHILQRWLMQIGASITYNLSLSPELNVAEFVFNNLNIVLKKEEFGILLHENVHAAVYEALEFITSDDNNNILQ